MQKKSCRRHAAEAATKEFQKSPQNADAVRRLSYFLLPQEAGKNLVVAARRR